MDEIGGRAVPVSELLPVPAGYRLRVGSISSGFKLSQDAGQDLVCLRLLEGVLSLGSEGLPIRVRLSLGSEGLPMAEGHDKCSQRLGQ